LVEKNYKKWFTFYSRSYKNGATSTHLSPVKKRVKENTPPETLVPDDNSLLQEWADNLKTGRSGREQKQTIVIADTPSPTPSIITISSDSEEEGEHRFNRSRRSGLAPLSGNTYTDRKSCKSSQTLLKTCFSFCRAGSLRVQNCNQAGVDSRSFVTSSVGNEIFGKGYV
jgi:hypothetical protein